MNLVVRQSHPHTRRYCMSFLHKKTYCTPLTPLQNIFLFPKAQNVGTILQAFKVIAYQFKAWQVLPDISHWWCWYMLITHFLLITHDNTVIIIPYFIIGNSGNTFHWTITVQNSHNNLWICTCVNMQCKPHSNFPPTGQRLLHVAFQFSILSVYTKSWEKASQEGIKVKE